MKFATFFLILVLSACGGDRTSNGSADNAETPKPLHGLYVYTDALNGCQYLRTGNHDSLVRRMKPDGTQVCGVGR